MDHYKVGLHGSLTAANSMVMIPLVASWAIGGILYTGMFEMLCYISEDPSHVPMVRLIDVRVEDEPLLINPAEYLPVHHAAIELGLKTLAEFLLG